MAASISIFRTGVFLGATGVALGAYGAHGLRKSLNDHYLVSYKPETTNNSKKAKDAFTIDDLPQKTRDEIERKVSSWQTAAWYQVMHSAVIVALARTVPAFVIPGTLFAVGTTLFSGSIYVLTCSMLKTTRFERHQKRLAERGINISFTDPDLAAAMKGGDKTTENTDGKPKRKCCKATKKAAYLTPLGGLLLIGGWVSLLFV